MLLVLAAVIAVALIVVERRAKEPLFALKDSGFGQMLRVNFATLAAGAVMFIAFYVAIYFAQEPKIGLGRDVAQAGLILAPAALLMLFFAPLAGRLTKRSGPKVVGLIGSVLAIVGMGLMLGFHSSGTELAVGMVVVLAGVAFLLTSLSIWVLALSPSEKVGSNTGLNTSFRTIGQSLGVTFAGAFLATFLLANSQLPSDQAYFYSTLVGIVLAIFGLAMIASLPRRRLSGDVGPVGG